MLIKSQKLSTIVSSQCPFEEDTQRWTITGEEFMFLECLRHTFSLQLLYRLTDGQSIWLREEIGHELVVIRYWF